MKKHAAILLVPAEWQHDDAIGISKAAYDYFREQFMGGLSLAVMRATPENKIVAQAELADGAHLADAKDWVGDTPPDGLGNPAGYVLPVRMLYRYSDSLAISREVVEQRVDNINTLEQFGFMPIDENTYDSLFDRHIENEGA